MAFLERTAFTQEWLGVIAALTAIFLIAFSMKIV
jgi:hypothetical protein